MTKFKFNIFVFTLGLFLLTPSLSLGALQDQPSVPVIRLNRCSSVSIVASSSLNTGLIQGTSLGDNSFFATKLVDNITKPITYGRFAVANHSLPKGLTLINHSMPASADFDGIPQKSGTFPITLRFRSMDSDCKLSTTSDMAIMVNDRSTELEDGGSYDDQGREYLGAGTVGEKYKHVFEVLLTQAETVSASVVRGKLPSGLNLETVQSTCADILAARCRLGKVRLSGTPVASGTYYFTVRFSYPGQEKVEKTYILIINSSSTEERTIL